MILMIGMMGIWDDGEDEDGGNEDDLDDDGEDCLHCRQSLTDDETLVHQRTVLLIDEYLKTTKTKRHANTKTNTHTNVV